MKIEPSVTLGLCVGVPKVANAGIYGQAKFDWDIYFSQKYHEAYLSGRVYAQVKTLFWESGQWDILKSDNMYLWQDNWGEPTLQTSSIGSESISINQSSPFNLSTDDFSVSDRKYINSMRWLGSRNSNVLKTSSLSSAEPNYVIKKLQTSIYDDSRQNLIDCNGQKMLIWSMDNKQRSAENRTMLVYSLYNSNEGTWSEPVAIDDDGTADFYPNAISVGNDVYVVWHNSKTVFNDNISFEESAAAGEICFAKFDGQTKKFGEATQITDNEYLDTLPVVISDNNHISVIWNENTENDIFGSNGRTAIMMSTFGESGWTEPTRVKSNVNAIYSLDACYSNGKIYISYSYDKNNDYSDSNDVDINQIIINGNTISENQITNNDIFDSNPKYDTIDGKNCLYWYSGGNIYFTDDIDSTNGKALFENSTISNDTFQIVKSTDNQSYIIWSDMNEESVSFYCSIFDGSKCTEPVIIGSTSGKSINPSAIADSNGNISIAYNNVNQVERTVTIGDSEFKYLEDSSTDLCLLTVNTDTDISVSDNHLFIDNSQVSPKETLELIVDVTNNGLSEVNKLDVYLDDEFVETVDKKMMPGDTAEINVSYEVPDEIQKTTVNIKVLPNSNNDTDESDNAVSVTYGYSDVKVENVKIDDLGILKHISAIVSNNSAVASGAFSIRIHEDSEDGNIIFEDNVEGLELKEFCSVDFSVSKSDISYDSDGLKKYYIEVIPESEDFDSSNNTKLVSFTQDSMLDISAAVLEKHLAGNKCKVVGVVSNNTLDNTTKYAKIEIFNGDTLIGCDLIKVNVNSKDIFTIEDTISLSGEYSDVEVKITLFDTGSNDIEITIPDGITEIESNQFVDCSDLVKINFPNSIIKIGANSFSGCSSLTNVVLPNAITSIGADAFSNCSSLVNVSVPVTVNSIGEGAFLGCPDLELMCFDNTVVANYAKENDILYNLIYGDYESPTLLKYEIVDGEAMITGCIKCTDGTVVIPDSIKGYVVTTISKEAFKNNNDIKNVTIGNNVELIDERAFLNCSSLESIVFGNCNCNIASYAFYECNKLESINFNGNVSSIERYAFANCETLKNISINDKLETIENLAFYNCESLETITVDGNNTALTVVDGILYDKAVSEMLLCPMTKSGKVELPNTVTVVRPYAVFGCENITSIKFNDNLQSIGNYAFAECYSIDEIVLPNSLTSLGGYAFLYCENADKIVVGNGLQNISNYAFGYCENVSEITIGSSVKTINSDAFVGCNSVSKINYNAETCGNFNVGSSPFTKLLSDTESLEVEFGESVIHIPAYLFYSTNSEKSSLKTIAFNNGLETIGDGAFYNCVSITSIDLPDSVVEIGQSAFYNCKTANTISLSNNLNKIGDNSFSYCNNVTSIDIPDSVKTIGNSAFYDCKSAESITIGENVTSLGNLAFYNANYVKNINYNAVTVNPLTSSSNVFYNAGNNSGEVNISIGEGVTAVPDYLFYPNTYATTVTIPDSVKTIGKYSFYGCTRMNTLNLGNSVEEIKEYAFYNCSSLRKLDIPNSVKTIGNYAFYGCRNLSELNFGSSISSIGTYAFYQASSLNNLNLPDSMHSIGDYAFANSSNLKTVSLGNNISTLNSTVFSSCNNLTSITGGSSGEFNIEDGVVFNSDKTELISCVTSKSGSYTIPDSVITICENAFKDCSGLTNIVIPESVMTIGNNAFYNCSNLKDLNLPQSVRTIGNNAFYNCNKITAINLPKKLKKLGSGAFSNCSSVTELAVNPSLTRIENSTFSNCYNISDIIIPDSITYVGDSAFYYCYNAKTITIGKNVSHIGAYAFYECNNISEINYNATQCDDFTTNQNRVFCYVGNSSSGVTLNIGDDVTKIPDYFLYSDTNSRYWPKITEINFGNNIETVGKYAFYNYQAITVIEGGALYSVGEYAFYNCDNLTTVTFAETAETDGNIDNYAFYDCDGLVSIVIPNSIKTIGYQAFYSCDSLKSVDVGNNVTTIGSYAFQNCTALEEITIGENVTTLGDGVLYNCTHLKTLNYNAENLVTLSLSQYSNNDRFYNVGSESGGFDFIVGDKVNCIPAAMFYPYNNNINYRPRVKSVSLGNSVETIGTYAFYNCYDIESFEGGAINSVGEYAFYNCDNLTTVTFAENAETDGSIDNYAFYDCDGLTAVGIPDSIKTIGYDAFYSCDALKSVDVGNGVKTIGGYAFQNCISIEEITVGKNVTSIGEGAFYYCTNLKTLNYNAEKLETLNLSQNRYNNRFYYVGSESGGFDFIVGDSVKTIPAAIFYPYDNNNNYRPRVKSVVLGESVDTIGAYAFYNCYDLTEVSGGDKLVNIGNSAFYNCTSLSSIKLAYVFLKPGSIGEYAFYNCSSLTSAIVPKNIKDIGNYCFSNCSSLTIFGSYGSNIADYATSNNIPFIGEGLVVLHKPYKTSYEIGESLDLSGIEVAYYDSDYNLSYIQDYSVSGFNSSKSGIQAVRIMYGDSTATFTVTVGFTLPETSHPYSNSMNRTWEVDIPDAKSITMTFSNESCTESGCDRIYIYDSTGNCLYEFTGSNFGGSSFTVNDGYFKIKFTSDGSVTNYGFSISDVKIAYKELLVNPNSTTIIDSKNNLIYGLNLGMILEDLIENYVIVSNDAYLQCDTEILGTGSVVNVYNKTSSSLIDSYTVVVYGDVTGDGYYDGMDAVMVNCLVNGMLTQDDVSTAVYMAADSNRDGIIDDNDVELLTQAGLLQTNIDQTGKVGFESDLLYDYVSGGVEITGATSDDFKTIRIPDEINGEPVVSISSDAFDCNTKLESVYIPATVSYLDSWTFYGCDSLKRFVVSKDNPNYLSDDYGVLYNKGKEILLQYPAGNSNEAYTIPEGVSAINDQAFNHAQNLKTIDLPDSLETIRPGAFTSCVNVESIVLPDRANDLGPAIFYNCKGLKTVNLPDGITIIPREMFYGCSSLVNVNIPNSVEWIDDEAFRYCSSLKSLKIPDKVSDIWDYCFANCTSLEKLYLGDGISSIQPNAFYNCYNLNIIYIPQNINYICEGAFLECNGEIDVYYEGTAEDWSSVNVDDYGNESIVNATFHFNSNRDDVINMLSEQ